MASKDKKESIKITERDLNVAQGLCEELLSLMGTSAGVEVEKDEENDAIVVDIQTTSEAGLLIGNRGRTLRAIQTVLGMMFRKRQGEWKRIIVNVADWREKEEARLKNLAIQTAERVRETGEEQSLYNLTASQRRLVHLTLADEDDIETESRGEGRDRHLVVLPSE